jgi:fumarate reductase subunit D
LGCGYAAGKKSYWLGAIAAVVALVAGVLIEWDVFYNEPLGRFLSLLHTLKPIKHLMHLLGIVAAFWFGMGRDARA